MMRETIIACAVASMAFLTMAASIMMIAAILTMVVRGGGGDSGNPEPVVAQFGERWKNDNGFRFGDLRFDLALC